MNQKELWNEKWNKIDKSSSTSDFAIRCFDKIKKRKFETLLDLGCGDGKDSIFFSLNGLKVTAVDFSVNGVKHLKQEIVKQRISTLKVEVNRIENIEFPDNSFDVIYASLSLQYFDAKTTKIVFNKIFKLLRKGGLFFIKVKSTDDYLCGKGQKMAEDMYEYENQIRHFFSEDFMKKNLQVFKIIEIKKISSLQIRLQGKAYVASFLEAIATK